MKLKELRRKKTIMALTAVAVTVVDWIVNLHFDKLFSEGGFWDFWWRVNLLLPFSNTFDLPITLLEIGVIAALGILMGKDFGEKAKLILLGLLVAFIAAYSTLLCLFLSTDIPILK